MGCAELNAASIAPPAISELLLCILRDRWSGPDHDAAWRNYDKPMNGGARESWDDGGPVGGAWVKNTGGEAAASTAMRQLIDGTGEGRIATNPTGSETDVAVKSSGSSQSLISQQSWQSPCGASRLVRLRWGSKIRTQSKHLEPARFTYVSWHAWNWVKRTTSARSTRPSFPPNIFQFIPKPSYRATNFCSPPQSVTKK